MFIFLNMVMQKKKLTLKIPKHVNRFLMAGTFWQEPIYLEETDDTFCILVA